MKKIVIVLISALFLNCSNVNIKDTSPTEQEMETALAIIRIEMAERLAFTLPKAQTAHFLSKVSGGYLPKQWAYPEVSHILKDSDRRLKVVLSDIEDMDNNEIVMMPWFIEDRLDQLASDNLDEGVPNMMNEDWADPDAVACVLLSILWNEVPSVTRYTKPQLVSEKADTTIWSFRIADGIVAGKNAPIPDPYFIVKVKNDVQGCDVYLQMWSGRIYLSPFFGKLSPDKAVEKTLLEAQIHAVAYSISNMGKQDIRYMLEFIMPSYTYTSKEDFSYQTVFKDAKRFFEFVNSQLQAKEVADSIVTRHSAISRVFDQYMSYVYKDTKDSKAQSSITLKLFAGLWGSSPKGYTAPQLTTTPDGDKAYCFTLTEPASPLAESYRSNFNLSYYVLDDGSLRCYYKKP
ncbi:MAG: hypothetical protein LBQ22_04955 [Bacteroidales bacterium]|jgi:hypothetical protein|nr:hypothetical protein [Bacteroidales bacterium]